MFNVVGSFLDYLPTYKAYHQRILEELYEDNVMYLEMRTGMGGVSENFRSKRVIRKNVTQFGQCHK